MSHQSMPVSWTAEDLDNRLDDVLGVFGAAMSYNDKALNIRRGYIKSHLRRKDFRAVATLDGDRLLGFAYGYHSEAGQWWHDQVSNTLVEDERQRWLSYCFELVELHVHPSAQGHGVGESQLRALLAQTGARTTLLSTPEADESASRAWRLYRRTGFVDVVRQLAFPGDPRKFAILGHELPL